MAVYKVPQDVEADDKFLGPLSFKQFLFGGGALISAYLIFLVVTNGAAFLAILFAPFLIIFVALAVPWSKDQPTELFLASRIRFMFMNRKRIWDQSGVKDLVTITVPKREVHVYTDGLNQDQVKSRLSALSNMVDSRGWAVKNMDHAPSSDRLVTTTLEPERAVEDAAAVQVQDILDDTSAEASSVDTAIKKSEDDHRKHTLDLVAEAREKSKTMTKSVLDEDAVDTNHTEKSDVAQTDPVFDSVSLPQVDEKHQEMKTAQAITPTQTPPKPKTPVVKKPVISEDEEQALLDKVHKKQAIEESIESHSHLKRIVPASQQKVTPANDPAQDPSTTSKTPVDPAILALAQNNDRSVDSLARETHKKDDSLEDEVVISLH